MYFLFILQPANGFLYVLGDNRGEGESIDSRDERIGWIHPERIVGEVFPVLVEV